MPKIGSTPAPPVTKPNKVIGIVGSRRRNSSKDKLDMIVAFDKIYREGDTLVSGGCYKGADSFAEDLAKTRGYTITIHYAAWYGPQAKAAGFIRNTKIAEDCDVLIAVVADDRTGGTEDTIRKVNKLGKKVILVKSDPSYSHLQ